MKADITELNNLIDASITRLNREKFANRSSLEIYEQQKNVTELKQLLSDLSGGAVSHTLGKEMALMLPPAGMTELEKAIVCVALYWLDRDIVEKECSGKFMN
jgi:hypothetical protein